MSGLERGRHRSRRWNPNTVDLSVDEVSQTLRLPPEPPQRERSGWAVLFGLLMLALFLGVVAVGSISVSARTTKLGAELPSTNDLPAASSSTDDDTPAPELTTTKPQPPVKQPPVKHGVVGVRIDTHSVMAQTAYVAHYRREFPTISKGHTDVGLAGDGAEICADVIQRTTKSHIAVELFEDEKRDGTPTSLANVYKIINLAITDICPQRMSSWNKLPQ